MSAPRRAALRDAGAIFALALAARLAVVVWAASRIPPAADGTYYHALATRLAAGHGYTWAWPDGAVTAAAHYPVGYPAMLSLVYRVFGASPGAAMVLGAILGALGAGAAVLLMRPFGRAVALTAGVLVAIHPALVPYAAALMTEVVAASLLLAACLAAAWPGQGRTTRLVLAGVLMGVATLVRPQCVLLAPVLGWLAASGERIARRAAAALVVAVIALATCAPWTIRNCVAMNRCALVSVNGGWNLLIGAQTQSGAWREIDVPESCRTVWDEAAKDACFEREAKARLLADPMAALGRVPAKLAVTFDYFGGAPWYLHEAAPSVFDAADKTRLGTADAVASRLLLAAALVAMTMRAWSLRKKRPLGYLALLLGALSLAFALTRHGWPAYLGFAGLAALAGPYSLAEIAIPWSAWITATVALIHAMFFGAGRYGLLVAPFIALTAALAPSALGRRVIAKSEGQCQE